LHKQLRGNSLIDLIENPDKEDWSKYNFAFMYNTGSNRRFKPLNVPKILFCHDFWPPKPYQWVIDWYQPDIILTTYPTQWKQYFKIPRHTKIVFYPMFSSMEFTRPNLGKKDIDLLVIGSTKGHAYKKRRELNKQIKKLKDYKIEFSNLPANKAEKTHAGWSEYLGTAKYVIFGEHKYPILLGKYYEALGSGAIPIFPEVPDLELLGLKAWEHYIPLHIMEYTTHFELLLDNHETNKYISENAVNWYKENCDKMLFDDFKKMIEELCEKKSK